MALSCLPCCDEGFGLLSALVLVRRHPRLVNTRTLRHPAKLFEVSTRSNFPVVRRFCDSLDEDALVAAFTILLEEVRRARIINVLIPLLNNCGAHGTLLGIAQKLDPHCMAEIIDRVPLESIAALLQAPPEKLGSILDAVQSDKASAFLIAVLLEPVDVLLGTVVPFIRHVSRPGRVGFIVNRLQQPDLLLWLLRSGVPAEQLATLIDTFNLVDFGPSEHVITFMKQLAGHQELFETRVVPLIRHSSIPKIVQLVHGMPCQQLLDLLRLVDTDGMLRLMENTNAGFVVDISALVGEEHMSAMAQNVSGGMAHLPVQNAVLQSTNAAYHVKAGLARWRPASLWGGQ